MKNILITLTTFTILTACIATNNKIEPSVNAEAFPDFVFNASDAQAAQPIKPHQFTTTQKKELTFTKCKDTLSFNVDKISEYEYFRFKLLLLSCNAIEKISKATASNVSFYPKQLSNSFYSELPAIALPALSEADKKNKQNKTINSYLNKPEITNENGAIKITTSEDEFYITLLARGDFNKDGIEDLLIKTEWYAKNSNGKHAELFILKKLDAKQAITVN